MALTLFVVGQILAKKPSNCALFHKSMKLGTGIDHGTRSNFSYGPTDKCLIVGVAAIIINY